MYYSAHGKNGGKWVDKDLIEFEKGHPVVYGAKHSNSNYPKNKKYVRIFGLADDETGRDILFSPNENNIVILEDQSRLDFHGFMDYDQKTPYLKRNNWYIYKDGNKSNRRIKRLIDG
jgi:hypothetical protein